MTDDQLLEYKKTEKEISILIEKNKKLKAMKKTEDPVPLLDPIEQDSNGSNFLFINLKQGVLLHETF